MYKLQVHTCYAHHLHRVETLLPVRLFTASTLRKLDREKAKRQAFMKERIHIRLLDYEGRPDPDTVWAVPRHKLTPALLKELVSSKYIIHLTVGVEDHMDV